MKNGNIKKYNINTSTNNSSKKKPRARFWLYPVAQQLAAGRVKRYSTLFNGILSIAIHVIMFNGPEVAYSAIPDICRHSILPNKP